MFKKYDGLSKQELDIENQKITDQYLTFKKQEKALVKLKNHNLWLLFLIPVFGLFFYQVAYKRRGEIPEIRDSLLQIKEKLIYCELNTLYIKKLLKNIENNEANEVIDAKIDTSNKPVKINKQKNK
ncbi:hypothetical protein [Spiroplasma endosymbiont of Aspidapion aeneum]|uniref:hypothetical protein n=1 Tax=Spiroplasma endosymbiont of Aspidapion aeneum TaxID=3066276 RepID=UPI00313BD599